MSMTCRLLAQSLEPGLMIKCLAIIQIKLEFGNDGFEKSGLWIMFLLITDFNHFSWKSKKRVGILEVRFKNSYGY